MKLYYSNTSPYARKVRLVIEEKGLQAGIESEATNAFSPDAALLTANPIGRVPTLILDDGQGLFGSQVICAYLDALGSESQLIPSSGWARWAVLRREALADGLMDAAYNIVMERKRSDGQHSLHWIVHWGDEIQRALLAMEQGMQELHGDITLAHLATASALGYLKLRIPDILYEDGEANPEFPRLLAWFEAFCERPSMRATDPGE